MSFEEMFSTHGSSYFYGGIIGCIVSVVLLIVITPIFAAAKKALFKKINEEY